MVGICLCTSGVHSDDVIIPWEPTKRADVATQSFIGFQAIIRVFRALGWLSSESGSRVVPKKFQLFQEFAELFSGIFLMNFRTFDHIFGSGPVIHPSSGVLDVHIVIALRLPGVIVGYKSFCILCSVPNCCWGFTAKIYRCKGNSNFTRASKSWGVV